VNHGISAPGRRILFVLVVWSAALTFAACQTRLPPPGPPGKFATISGVLWSEDPRVQVRGRLIQATDVSSGQTYRVRTSDDGVFAFLIPAGSYRLSTPLNRHEVIVERPGEIAVGGGDASVGANLWVDRR
jgi:hypothetical protein